METKEGPGGGLARLRLQVTGYDLRRKLRANDK